MSEPILSQERTIRPAKSRHDQVGQVIFPNGSVAHLPSNATLHGSVAREAYELARAEMGL